VTRIRNDSVGIVAALRVLIPDSRVKSCIPRRVKSCIPRRGEIIVSTANIPCCPTYRASHCVMVNDCLPTVKAAGGQKLGIHVDLKPRLSMRGVTTLLLPYISMECSVVHRRTSQFFFLYISRAAIAQSVKQLATFLTTEVSVFESR
jgi:hypothetical protein